MEVHPREGLVGEERSAAGERLEEQAREGVDVDAVIERVAVEALGAM
ncbi:hypothetical protein [Pseudonocardia thermophila]|nr:hypothetical protein [Pseudonocardia thermophila]